MTRVGEYLVQSGFYTKAIYTGEHVMNVLISVEEKMNGVSYTNYCFQHSDEAYF